MNPELDKLNPYPFERLRSLFAQSQPAADKAPIALSIGEPQHPVPELVHEALLKHRSRYAHYPQTRGLPELRQAIAQWLNRRYQLGSTGICAETAILPVNGTREALFAFAQAIVDRNRQPLVLFPNPFYQIYEGAALLAGAEPGYLPCTATHHWLPDFAAVPATTWERCQLLYICSPGNPTGAVIPESILIELIHLADKYNFVIASDECYSEIYTQGTAPNGLLGACARIGRHDFTRCVVFHSLSKRSNIPGLRSGFIAGDASILQRFLLYRTYHGCAMPIPVQMASIAAWNDEQHVIDNRTLYRDKFEQVRTILANHLPTEQPDAGFYLWIETPFDDTQFCRLLYEQQNLTLLPGQFLGRVINGANPGSRRIRMALVPSVADCVDAAQRIRDFMQTQRTPIRDYT
jgi:N-succinyldiaminopimelate aminotransferase